MASKFKWAIPQTLFPEKDSGLSLREIHLQIRIATKQTADDLQIAVAEEITTTALHTYWQHLQDLHHISFPFKRQNNIRQAIVLAEEDLKLARWLGAAICTLPILNAAYYIGRIYTDLLPPKYRTRNGIFYTPPALANRLLDQAEAAGIDWKKAKVLDPACGGSAFLVPTAIRIIDAIKEAEPSIIIQNIEARLFGWEIDPFAAWLSNFFVEAICLPLVAKTGRRIKLPIFSCDSLTQIQSEYQFDLVVGNPPFGRIRLPQELRFQYRHGLYGHANLYGLFTELAVRLTRPNGLIAFITPASYLAGEYFKNLRALLWHDAQPVSIDFVENRKDVFEGVLQETVLATYQKKENSWRQATVSIIRPKEEGVIEIESAGSFALPDIPTAPWILPRSVKDMPLSQQMRLLSFRLADWGYKVSTGPLVWNRHKDQLRDEKGENTVPLVWAESVTPDGRFQFRCKKRNHKPYFFLRPEKDNWLRIDRACVLVQRTTAKEQNRRLIAAAMPQAFIAQNRCVTVENHLNMLLPLNNRSVVASDVLAAFLNSTDADRAFRCISGSVAVSAYELENLPLPDPMKLDRLTLLVRQNATKDKIENACRSLYGIEV